MISEQGKIGTKRILGSWLHRRREMRTGLMLLQVRGSMRALNRDVTGSFQLLDLSENGLGIISASEVPVNDELSLYLPECDVEFRARVAFCSLSSDYPGYRVGLQVESGSWHKAFHYLMERITSCTLFA